MDTPELDEASWDEIARIQQTMFATMTAAITKALTEAAAAAEAQVRAAQTLADIRRLPETTQS